MSVNTVYGSAVPSAATASHTGGLARCSSLGFGRKALQWGLITASFDVFLVADVGGFTFRIHQLLLGLAFVSMIQISYKDQGLRMPPGMLPLIIWVAFILAFIPNTVYLARSIGYGLWLILDVCIVFVTVQLFGNRDWIASLLRAYLKAFILVGGFGLLQFLLGILRAPDPFVKQWFIPGIWPRINGFSYEPSYFSTYMLLGWVFSAWLVERGVFVLGRRLTWAAFVISSAAIVLATSRIGWMMMIAWGIGYAYRRVCKPYEFRIPPAVVVTGLLCLGVAFVGVNIAGEHLKKKTVAMLAGGTGLYGTPAHSVNNREQSLTSTIEIFQKSPFIGYSLGGVATAIGSSHGTRISDNSDAKHNEGGSVAAEVLAASGIIGIIPLIAYFTTLFRKPLAAITRCDRGVKNIVVGLAWALCMELLVLQFNQNILRAYLWFHLAVVSAVYSAMFYDGWGRSSEAVSDNL
jgi:hypothetical protein